MVEAIFKDGRRAKYSNSVVDMMCSDMDVIEVVDLETGEVLIDRGPIEKDFSALAQVIDLIPAITSMGRTSFMSMCGVLIDKYGADNDYSSAETIFMLEQLVECQKKVHEIEGMMQKCVK